MISSTVQKLFNLMLPHLFIFAFIFFVVVCSVRFKNHHQDQCQGLTPLFPSNSCLISSLGFQSFIHFKVMLMYVARWWSSLILLPMAVWFSQYHLLWRNYLFPLVSSWLFCHKWIDLMRMFVSGLRSVPLACVCVLFSRTVLLWLLYLCNVIWDREVWCL